MRKWLLLTFSVLFVIASPAQDKEKHRLADAYTVLNEVVGMPDKGIPLDLLNKADCVIVVPSEKKAAFIVGASYGRGVMTCRSGENFRGSWSAPAMYAIEGGSFGFQIGGQATDFVLLIMNEKGATSVMSSGITGRRARDRPASAARFLAMVNSHARKSCSSPRKRRSPATT